MHLSVIGQDTLDRIRSETDLVALIGESLKLQKRGRSFVGLCPFHKEKSPSFHVSPERGFYHCFGCHESGDAIKFVQRVQGLEFIEAIRYLGERAGIEVETHASVEERQRYTEARRRSDELYEVSNTAAGWFERMLREHPLSGYAQAELERRALVARAPADAVADALQAFRIGYAPYGWEGLSQHLRERGVSLPAAERVGLVAPRKSGAGYYDRFRHRLMFAVCDAQGRVIAFSGRALDEPSHEELAALKLDPPSPNADKPAKYYNSPESAIYKKREALFGIYQARQAIRTLESAVLVEGNFDVVSLHARGMKHVIAPLGTAFTVEQAQQIRRFCADVVLLFDGDSAGRRAVHAAREACQRAGLSARVATLPDGIDPDELARREGKAGVERVIAAAQPILSYLIEATLDEAFARDDVQAQAAILKTIGELIQTEEDPAARALVADHARRRIAERLNLTDAPTFRSVAAMLQQRAQAPAVRDGNRPTAAPAQARSENRAADVALEILGAFLDFPELMEEADCIDAAALFEGDVAVAFAAMRQAWVRDRFRDPEVLLAKLAPPIHAFARARLARARYERPEDAKKTIADNVVKLEKQALVREKNTVRQELERPRRTGSSEQEDAMLQALFEKARLRQKAQKKLLASD